MGKDLETPPCLDGIVPEEGRCLSPEETRGSKTGEVRRVKRSGSNYRGIPLH